ncbi:MAG: NACHT domain-containing protein [Chloroflexi bacterium]|nr:NACHT domain-containing protein [Chloroflexota bacterium]
MTDEQQDKQSVQGSDHVAQANQGGTAIVGDGNVIDTIEQRAGDSSIQLGKARDVTIHQYAGPASADEERELGQMRVEYLESLQRRFEYLDLGGIAPRVQNRTVKLRMDDVFVPVQTRPELESDAGWPDWVNEISDSAEEADMTADLAWRMMARGGRGDDGKPMEIADLLRRPQVVVLGDPGCGKSTLLRYIAYAMACGMGENVGAVMLERLPIFVRIVQFSQAQANSRALTLDTYIRETCEPKWAALFQHVLDSGEALVLLDGLDEVVDAHQRKGIAEAIQRLVADYPGNMFVVASRIVGYQAARLSGDFVHYTIQPLPPERITEFVEKWYQAIEREAGAEELSEDAQERAQELSKTIQERPGIHRLAENPLLLTIIALVNWRGRKLPNRRVELYAHAAETLIASWPYRRHGVELDTERVIRLLSPVAYRIFATRSSGDISEDELLSILSDIICHIDGVEEREAIVYAKEFLGQISERSGIFRERGYDERGRRVFGFLHLTFAEYFTARYLAGLWEGLGEDADARRAFLRKYAHVSRWREVVLLMAGDVGLRDSDRAERATRLAGDILTLSSEYEEYLHRDLLLAGMCLADDLRVQRKAANYVLSGLLEFIVKFGAGTAIYKLNTIRETTYGQLLIKGLLTRLEDDNRVVRRNVMWALGAIGDSRVIEALLTQLEDKEESVKSRAMWALGQIGDVQAVKPLLTQLQSKDRRMRANAVWALGRIGDIRVVETLLTQMENEHRGVRQRIVDALGDLDSTRVIEVLLEQLEDKDDSVRTRATWALGRSGDVRAVEPLLALLKSENRNIRLTAIRALGRIGDVRAVEPLLANLEDEDVGVRWRVAKALGMLNDTRAVEPLLARLKDDHVWVRWRAASALGKLGDDRAVEALLMDLEDEDAKTRWRAAKSLGELSDVRAIDPLLTRLKDKDGTVRWRATEALGAFGDTCMVKPLLSQLKDEERWVRASAVDALGMLGDVSVVESLLERLEDEDKWVRRSATIALGKLGDVRAVSSLLARLEDADWEVCEKAYNVLIAILDRNAPDPEVEEMACEPQDEPGPWDD